MNEANRAVREAAKDVAVEILGALGVQPQEMDSHFEEGAAGAAVELRLTRFAEAIFIPYTVWFVRYLSGWKNRTVSTVRSLEQVKPKPPIQPLPRAIEVAG